MDTYLSNDERELLFMLLQKEEKMLHLEISKSSHREFRDFLKERLQKVNLLQDKLKVAEPLSPEYGFM